MAIVGERREVRWWMAWRSTTQNVLWLQKNRKAVTTVHPAHHLFEVALDGTLEIGKGYSSDEHVQPYLDLGVHVMPCIDVRWSAREEKQSAIYQGILEGDETVLSSLKESISSLAKLANDHRFSGYVIDYEPTFEYTLEHVEALQKFISMLKEELAQYDVDFAATCSLDTVSTRRRVGVCVSDWGIINVVKSDFAKVYLTKPEDGGADIVMSMAYTYYPPEAGSKGFAELEYRCAVIASLFGERATLGIGAASNDKRFENWFSDPDDTISKFVRSVPRFGAVSLSVWGMWHRENDPDSKEADKFSPALAEFLNDSAPALCAAAKDGGLVVA